MESRVTKLHFKNYANRKVFYVEFWLSFGLKMNIELRGGFSASGWRKALRIGDMPGNNGIKSNQIESHQMKREKNEKRPNRSNKKVCISPVILRPTSKLSSNIKKHVSRTELQLEHGDHRANKYCVLNFKFFLSVRPFFRGRERSISFYSFE